MEMRTFNRVASALPLALALVACGGGGGGDDSGNGSDGGGSGSPQSPAWSERIEPFEPKAAPVLKTAQLVSDPTGAVASFAATRIVRLGGLPPAGAGLAATPTAVGVPRQIGQARAVPEAASAAATAPLLQWQPTARGTQVAALRFESEGARGVRLGVLVESLPQGAWLRFYGAAPADAVQLGAQELQAMAARNAGAGATDEVARTYWSPDFGAAQTTLEVEIPASASPAAVRLAVPRLSHLSLTAADADQGFTTKAAAAGSCLVDASCQPDYLEQGRSVARMTFVDNGDAYFCTGTLLNDRASSGTPYFLSANHCITSQAVASTLVTDWLYRSTSCGGTSVDPASRRLTGGATLLHASASTDTAFMRLNDAVPAGVVYAGSYYGGVPVNTALASLLHTRGELQTISLGTLIGYENCSDTSCQATGGTDGNYMKLSWQLGSAEQGSSGAGVFVAIGARRYLAGQLHGGTASCDRPDGADYFGRFDRSYRAALRQWLSP